MVKFLRKVSDSEQTKKSGSERTRTALNVILSNCTKARNFSRELHGDSIPPRKLKTRYYGGLPYRIRAFSHENPAFWHASQTFQWEVSKNI